MSSLNLKTIEENVRPLARRDRYDREFIFDLLAAYGRSTSSITRLRNGPPLNVADDPSIDVAQKNVVYFKPTTGDLYAAIDELRTSPAVVRFTTRFAIVTDYVDLLAVDTKTDETLAAPLADIDKHFTFFLPWAGMEKAQYTAEAHADVKAAERMAKLFDELVAKNPHLQETYEGRHALNVFFTRLLFCFFAEDTGIFDDGQFTDAVSNYTQLDGSDVHTVVGDVFAALDAEEVDAKPHYLRTFPYVNGRLFSARAEHVVPEFTKEARDLLIESGRLRWHEINPDIFGSMFQAVVTPGQRSDLGQHYTSVPNILKTIEPLFLDGLKDELNENIDNLKKLKALLDRIGRIKVFDPACGSGNFLVIAYKELRRLEHAILERIEELTQKPTLFAESRISIENFYGIEIDDFAVETAILSLWIAKHQMNREFLAKFNLPIALIPLKEAGKVQQGNAARVDWNSVCANNGEDEIYLIGNPPYAGSKVQAEEQKADFARAFGHRKHSKNLDYISIWFYLGARYIGGTSARLAFVTTNSVAQGEHVGLLFPLLYEHDVEIGFARTSFKWENNAKRNAGVTVAVIALRRRSSEPKYIFTDDVRLRVSRINGYLVDGDDVFIHTRRKSIAGLPAMSFGSMPNDGGSLVLTSGEREALIEQAPNAQTFTKAFLGSNEFINGLDRYALWMESQDVGTANQIEEIAQRVERVRRHRADSKRPTTNLLASVPWRFGEVRYKPTESIIVPSVSSESREYIPIGYLDKDTVISNAAFAVYDAEPWLFALLTSAMHMAWTRAVGGRLKTDYRYSNTIVYNNFPVPHLTAPTKERLTESALRVLDVREYHSEQTLAGLYNPDEMPDDLRLAHREVDEIVDQVYRRSGFQTDEDRLSHLFDLYAKLTAEEKRA